MARPVELGGKGTRFIAFASACLIVAALYFGRAVLMPLALAVLLSFLLTPATQWLERWRIPRTASTLVVVISAVSFLAIIGYLAGRQLVSVVDQLPNYRGELEAKLNQLRSKGGFFRRLQQEAHAISSDAALSPAGSHPATSPAVSAMSHESSVGPITMLGNLGHAPTTQYSVQNPLPVRIVPEAPAPLLMIKNYATNVLDPLATAGLVLVFVIFMLLTREDLRDRMIRLVGHGRLNLTTQALDEAGTRISRYLSALAIVNGCYAVAVAGGLWVIGHFLSQGRGFPNVLVWGLLVGLFRFVPYVGIWIGAAVPLILSFALFAGSAVFFATVGLFLTLEVIVSQFIEPFWYGASTGMSALAVLVAAVFWTWLWGPIGLLLSTPLTVCLVVIGKYVPQMQFLDILLGDEPVLPLHARVYQRLIASDEEEAADLVREQLETKPLEAIYDEVLIPALALATQDHYRGRLDEHRHQFIRQSMRGMVEELGEEQKAHAIRNAAGQTEKAAKDQPIDAPAPKPLPSIPRDCTVNVLCLPAKDEADEIVALMLAQVLDLRGYRATTASADSLASELVEMVEARGAHIVCVSAMPPSAVAHARYLCKRIHLRFPELPMMIGLWLAKGDLRKAKHRIACSESVRMVTTLAQAEHEIDQRAQPILLRNAEGQPTEQSAAVR